MSETAEEREQRVLEMLAKAMYPTTSVRFHEHVTALAEKGLTTIRAAGGDVTVPDLPEPTYEFSGLTQRERDCIVDALDASVHRLDLSIDFRDRCRVLHEKLRWVKPDPVTS